MKKLLKLFSFACLSGLILASCEKETELNAPAEMVGADKALLKINYVSAYAKNPSVHLKLNDVRVSNVITSRTPFPGGGYNTGGGSANDYLAVNPGNINVKVAIPNAGKNTDSVELFSTAVNLLQGKNYTAHITDTGANTQVVLVEDILTRPDTGQARFKFIHLMPDVPALDLYYGSTKVASNIPYLGVSPYFDMPVPSANAAWTIRPAGAPFSDPALATYTSGNTTLSTRVYTAFATGYGSQTGSTNTRRPFISFMLNN